MAQKSPSDLEKIKNGTKPVNGSARAPLKLGKDYAYDDELRRLQIELVKLQEWIRQKGLKLVVLFRRAGCSGERRSDQEDHRDR